MADIQSNIQINIDAADAVAELKSLQRQISTFHTQMAKAGRVPAFFVARCSRLPPVGTQIWWTLRIPGPYNASRTSIFLIRPFRRPLT